MVVYNRVGRFHLDGRTARVNAHTRTGPLSFLPGYLKTVNQEITVTADDTLRVNPVPRSVYVTCNWNWK